MHRLARFRLLLGCSLGFKVTGGWGVQKEADTQLLSLVPAIAFARSLLVGQSSVHFVSAGSVHTKKGNSNCTS